MGAGRIVYQELTRITKEIMDGTFFENPAIIKSSRRLLKNSDLHFWITIRWWCSQLLARLLDVYGDLPKEQVLKMYRIYF